MTKLVFSGCLVNGIWVSIETVCAQLVLARLEWVVEELVGVVSEVLDLIIDHKVEIKEPK